MDQYCLAVLRHLLIVDADHRFDENWTAEYLDIDIKPTDRELQLVLEDCQQAQPANSDNFTDMVTVKKEPPNPEGYYYDGLETYDNEQLGVVNESQGSHFMTAETELDTAANVGTSQDIMAADYVEERIIGCEVTEEMDVSYGSCQSFEEEDGADLVVSSVSSLYTTTTVPEKRDNTAPDFNTLIPFTSSQQHGDSKITNQVKNEHSDSAGKCQTCTQRSFEGLFFCVPFNIVSYLLEQLLILQYLQS